MGIDTSALLIVGRVGSEIRKEASEAVRNGIEENGFYETIGEDGELGLHYASPYYDSDSDDRVWGFQVAAGGDYRPREFDPAVLAEVPELQAKFKELTGMDAKLYLSPHVT